MAKQHFTLTHLRALMDQDQARIEEARRLYISWAEKKHMARNVRMIMLFLTLVAVNITWLVQSGDDTHVSEKLVLVALIGFSVIVTTFFYTMPARYALYQFHKGEAAYLKNTWGAKAHPQVVIFWNDEIELYQVFVAVGDELHEAGMVDEDDSFLNDFGRLVDAS